MPHAGANPLGARSLHGPEAPLTDDDLEALTDRAHDNRVDQTVLRDVKPQFLEIGVAEVPPGVPRGGVQQRDGNLDHFLGGGERGVGALLEPGFEAVNLGHRDAAAGWHQTTSSNSGATRSPSISAAKRRCWSALSLSGRNSITVCPHAGASATLIASVMTLAKTG